MHAYLSDGWLAEVAALLAQSPQVERASKSFVVNYVVDDAPEGCARRHAQLFADGHLAEWSVGGEAEPDLIVRRSYDVDRDDLLGRAAADDVANASMLMTTGSVSGDVFGVGPGATASTGLPAGLEFGLGLCSPDSAFGIVERRYVVDREGVHPRDVEELDVVVRGPYANVLAWLHHEDRLLGHFLVCDDFGTTVDGDYFKLSAIEGVVSAPKPSPTTDHAAGLLDYAVCRRRPRVQEALDAIDAFTR